MNRQKVLEIMDKCWSDWNSDIKIRNNGKYSSFNDYLLSRLENLGSNDYGKFGMSLRTRTGPYNCYYCRRPDIKTGYKE